MACPDVDDLVTYLQFGYPSRDVKTHVAACERCGGYRRIIRLLREAYPIPAAPISDVVVRQILAAARRGRGLRNELN